MKFILANLFILSFLGIGIIYQLKGPLENPLRSPSETTLTPEGRAPASIKKNPDLFPRSINKIKNFSYSNELVINLACNNDSLTIKTKNESAILTGNHCLKLDQLKIINLSNGYTASIFEIAEKKYKTDLIPLTVGANKISVAYKITAKKKEPTEKTAFFIINRDN
jgi:hypothetical protein